MVPRFLCKITPAGRKVFMLQYRTNAGERRKPAGVPHMAHSIRHRATTDIANSGVPPKVGMKLTGHKTVAMFMHYVHTEDKPVQDAAELVVNRRLAIAGVSRSMEATA